jgi:glycosyltransferase involved in cell wall biosynthesis
MKLFFVIPGDIHSLTGGYLYNKRIAEGLRQRDYDVQILGLDDPLYDTAAIEKTCRMQFGKLEKGSWVVIDSLALGLLGTIIREFKNHLHLVGLIHLPVSYDPLARKNDKTLSGNELEALQDTCHLILTGKFIMHILLDGGLAREKMSLVEPGVDLFPRKPFYARQPSELLCISNYSAVKAQHVLVNALSKLRKWNWTMRLYGNTGTDRDYVNSLVSLINREKLQKRILLYDTLERKNMSAQFLKADLFIFPSVFESYGMVLTESLSHGIPVLTTTAGNIPNTVPPSMGMFTEPGNSDEMAAVLEELFMDEGKYRSLCEAASVYYRQARPWSKAVDEFEQVIRMNL